MHRSVTVLGGGNTAFAVAAKLTLEGNSVTLCELPGFEDTVEPIRDSRLITLDGVGGYGDAVLRCVTTDFGLALSETEAALLIVPAYGHRAFARSCAPHLREGQVVVLMPGTLGSLEFSKILREHGAPASVVVAETDTAPYVCRKLTPTAAHIWGIVGGLGLGVLPSTEGERVRRLLDPWFPGLRLYANVLAAGLSAMNPVVHPAGVLLNAGRIERSRGEFYFYEEGVTPAVCRLIYSVDRERLAVAAALGLTLDAVDTAFHSAGFGPKGDLWATINGSRMLTQLRAPVTIDSRWMTEDVPYGLASWAMLGEQIGVHCPVMRSLVELVSSTLGTDFWASARTLDDLGIAGMTAAELVDFVRGATDAAT